MKFSLKRSYSSWILLNPFLPCNTRRVFVASTYAIPMEAFLIRYSKSSHSLQKCHAFISNSSLKFATVNICMLMSKVILFKSDFVQMMPLPRFLLSIKPNVMFLIAKLASCSTCVSSSLEELYKEALLCTSSIFWSV